ncbi:MAG: pseudouridine synthase [Sphingobacteriales bacterium]|jgi:23S rRNA pseudouridine2457 synthase|nr:pseudouridine synthase [Sphingobacteriales bacterium]
MYRYFLLYKPFGVLSQFTEENGHPALGSLFDFPKRAYPVGRLDLDSEGLLVLTDDPTLNARLLDPKRDHSRTYLVLVEGLIDDAAIRKLEEGVELRIDGRNFKTAKARASLIPPPEVPERTPPVRFRKTVPDSWISLSLNEGKNRQVRRMTAAVGFPTLRLIRWAIGNLQMEDPKPGKVLEFSREELLRRIQG